MSRAEVVPGALPKELPEVIVTLTAAKTPVGANAEMTCAALGAGIVPFAEYPHLEATPEDPEWDADLPILVSAVPPLDAQHEREQRLFLLLSPVLEDLFSRSRLRRAELERTGVYFSLPQALINGQRVGISEQWHTTLLRDKGLGKLSKVAKYNEGCTGFFAALAEAKVDLQRSAVDYAVVIAADTLIDNTCLSTLDEAWRLKTERNVDGFIPGESATAFLLERKTAAQSRGFPALAQLLAQGQGYEKHSMLSPKQSSGNGLADAIDTVILHVGECKLKNIYCDLNGESYAAYEWGLMLTRCAKALEGTSNLYHPADACGDVGAATGGLLLLQAIAHLRSEESTEDTCFHLLWSASDDGHRRALAISR